jgi:hypothetical protein
MGTVLAAASALVVAAAGAAAALSAPFGAVGHGGQYLAGHVLLGLGLGQSIAILLRMAVKRLVVRRAVGNAPERVLPGRPNSSGPRHHGTRGNGSSTHCPGSHCTRNRTAGTACGAGSAAGQACRLRLRHPPRAWVADRAGRVSGCGAL